MSSDAEAKRFTEERERTRGEIEARLGLIADEFADGPRNVRDAVRYALLGGGKRLRPTLCVWTHEATGGDRREAALDAACAIECVHTYSLVHDDLPCMDDDDLRRGKPTCHKRYGEAMAVLAGDALLTMAFEIIASLGARRELDAGLVVETLQVLSRAAGVRGLITGQALDLMPESLEASLETVERIHRHKTAALIAASMETGAVIAGAENGIRGRVRRAGDLAGRAFQIIDDVLDIQMDSGTLGKTAGKDVASGKLTFPSVAGVEASKRQAANLVGEAKKEIAAATKDSRLGLLLDTIVSRSS